MNPDDRTLRREVTLVLETAELAESVEALPLSVPSETWSLYWR
ncbi:MAG: hypothetical protein ACE5NP_07340 [Anaerolineae bacterium]